MTKRELLSAVPFFSDLSEDALNTLESHMRLRTFRRGQPIFIQGDPGDSLFLVASGRVKLLIAHSDGEQLTILFCGPGTCFGEMAVLDGKARSASAEALELTETWVVTRNDFLDLMRRAPDISNRNDRISLFQATNRSCTHGRVCLPRYLQQGRGPTRANGHQGRLRRLYRAVHPGGTRQIGWKYSGAGQSRKVRLIGRPLMRPLDCRN